MISYLFRLNVTNDTHKILTLTTAHKTNIEFIMDSLKTLKQLDIWYNINENGIHAYCEVNEAKREIANSLSATLVFPKAITLVINIQIIIFFYKQSVFMFFNEYW